MTGAARRKNGGKVKAREIVLIGILFFAGFLITEFLIEHMRFDHPFQRFIARIIFQAGFYIIVYFLFALRDTNRRIRRFEAIHSREKRIRLRGNRSVRKRRTFIRKGINGQYKGR
jgi:hypothetical protein